MHQTHRLVSPQTQPASPPAFARFVPMLVGVSLMATIVVLSGYALTTTPVLPRTVHVSLGLTGILFVWFVMTGKPLIGRDNGFGLAFAGVLSVTALLSALLQSDASLAGTLQVPVLIICGYLLSQAIPFDTFVRWFSGSMAVFSLIALVAWLLFIVLELPLVGGQVINYNGAVYNNGFIFFLLLGWDGLPIDRSMGPFWEPGLFASFIVIGLLAEISFRTAPVRKWVIISLLLGIGIAQSTAGFLLIVPALALFLFRKRTTTTGVIAFIISLLALTAYTQLESIIRRLIAFNPEIFGKLEQEALQSSSRLKVLELNFQIFSDSPLIGWGFEGANREVLEQMASSGVAAQTSTSTYFLAALGIIGLLYTLGWFAVLLDTSISLSERIIILVCFLIIVNKEPHSAILVTFIFLFYFLSRMKPPDKFQNLVGKVASA